MLNGLGLVERQLLPVCRQIFGGDIDYEDGTWALSKKLFLYAWARLSPCGPERERYIEAYTIGKDAEILERTDAWDPYSDTVPVFMARMKGTKQSLTYFMWEDGAVGIWLRPPYKVIKHYDDSGFVVAVQDTAHFVKQFGPYDWGQVVIE